MADIRSVPVELNFEHYEGDDFLWETVYAVGETVETAVPVNFTGWTGVAQIVSARDDATAVTIPLTVTLGSAGLLRLEGAGEDFLDITSAGKKWKGVWDVRLTDTNGRRRTYFAGRFTVAPRAA